MTDWSVREYNPLDMPAMAKLFHEVFGDSEAMITSLHSLLPDMGTAAVAEADGKVIGAFYVIAGMELISQGLEKPVCAYLYALSVAPEYRGLGIGRSLTLKAFELAKQREAKIICTLPAEPSLYGWYSGILGTASLLHRRRFETDCRALDYTMEMSSTEYMIWRETLLRGKTHMHPSHTTLEFLRQFCKTYGGGLFACGSGLCSVYVEGDTAYIHELITNEPSDCEPIAASVGAAVGAEKAVYWLPDTSGDDYVLVLSGSVPSDCIWNVTFE